MEFEDSRFALFPEPNAYVQNFNNEEKKIKKVVFQEPYETLPNFYLNNNFKKHSCKSVSKNKPCDCCPKQQNGYNCNHGTSNNNCGCVNNKDNCNNGEHQKKVCSSNSKGFGFDFKNLLPLLGFFNKGGGADFSQLVGLLNNGGSLNNENSNPSNLISSILSNKDMLSGIMNMFNGGGMGVFNKVQPVSKKLKTTDYEIKNYTKV